MSVNYLSLESNTFFLCQNCGHGESSSPHQHTLICNGGPDRQSTRTQTRTRARTSASRCRLCPPVSVQNQTLHPSAGVIPSDHGHIAIQWRFSHTNVSITAQRLVVFHSIRCPHLAFPPPSSFNFSQPPPLQVDSVYLFMPFPPCCIDMAVLSLGH